MEETDLRNPAYWEAPGIDIRLNPRLDLATDGLAEFIRSKMGLDSATVFATSGSTGTGPKFVVLKKEAVLASARAVNRHLEVSKNDRWLCALTTFHVGGAGVWARAHLAGCRAYEIEGEGWDRTGSAFTKACRDHELTLTALTPTHLHDVVGNGHEAPESLRAILIGGDALDSGLLRKAVRLGWPVLRTYGMTEAASQVATDEPGMANREDRPEWLSVLPGWEVRTGEDERLEIRGAALFHGYAIRNSETAAWTFAPAAEADGFFTAGDRVRLGETSTGMTALSFLGRSDDLVKKLGEQVSLLNLRETIRRFFPEQGITILARPHERSGSELVAVVETGDVESVRERVEIYNESVAPFERIDRIFTTARMPRTGIGKIAHGRLAGALERGELTALETEDSPS